MPYKCAVRAVSFAIICCVFPFFALAQTNAVPSRITQSVSEANLTVLHGNTHPLAQARFDQGAAPDSLPLQRMLLVLKRSSDQQAALDVLLDQQQDSSSSNYHQWLTPQQFGQQFGPSDQDLQTITNWLQSHGFTVNSISNGRTVVEFSGTAGQVGQAFHTTMHRYTVNGADRWANSSDPQIPIALAPVVAGINTLYNFPRQSMHEFSGTFDRSRATGAVTRTSGTQFTFPIPCTTVNPNASNPFCFFALAPADFAKIYNVPNLALNPVPSTQYNGDGQTIAIVGESDINPNDVATFRTLFGLPAPNLNVIVNGPDPGFNGAESEGDIDVQWAGAVAPNATIDYVVAEPTEVSLGVDLAAQYAVDNNLGSVLSESYGICEFFMGTADNIFYNQLWQQAAAQGITVTVSSGDGGSAACDQNAGTEGAAAFGLTVSGFTSTPYNVSVGGTDFNDIANFSQFWNVTPSDTPKEPSALGYIPELTWNNTCTNQELFGAFGVTGAAQSCNNSHEINDGLVSIGGGSGGQSNCTVSDGEHESQCSGGYAKPSWQMGAGVPADGKRDIPDLSFFASNGFNGTFYIICEKDLLPSNEQTGNVSCDPNAPVSSFAGFGGTSVSTPAFAGIMALVNQATHSRQGNANYILYKLAAQLDASCTSAANPASTCVFYDVPAGSTIAMPCAQGSPNEPAGTTNLVCPTNNFGPTGVLSGYGTTAGYDLATGLGSVNAANLIGKWTTFTSNLKGSSTTLTLDNGNPVNITHGQSIPITVAVAGTGGTPTGSVSLIAQTGADTQQGVGSTTLTNGSATFSTTSLPGGSYNVFAQYSGDSTFKSSSSATQSVSVAPEASKVTIDYELFNPSTGAQTSQNATSATFGASGLLRYNVTSQSGDACAQNLQNPSDTSGCPIGNVTVTDSVNGGTAAPLDAGTYALNNQGYAEDQTVYLTGGQHTIVATYPVSDDSYTAPASATDSITITKAPTTIGLGTPSPLTPHLGSYFSVAATISTQVLGPPTAELPSSAGGGVQFFIDSAPVQLGTNSSVTYTAGVTATGYAQLTATLSSDVLTAGAHTLTAQYMGDANYAASTLSPGQTVHPIISTAVNLQSQNTTPVAGTSVLFTATINPSQQFSSPPTGNIVFTLSSPNAPASQTQTVSNSQASAAFTMPQGEVYIEAQYQGDANYADSFTTIIESVTAITTSVTISPSNPSPQVGSNVTYTASVSNTQTNAPAPTGTVTFNMGGSGAFLGSALLSSTHASISSAALPVGAQTVTATYGGDAYHTISTGSLLETLSAGPTTTTIASSAPSIIPGTSVIFHAQVTGESPGAPIATGSVQFSANGASLGTVNLAGGTAQVSTSALQTLGSASILAIYSGDSDYSGSTGNYTENAISTPTFSVTANPTSVTISAPGQSASTTLTFTSAGGLTGSGGLSTTTCGTSSSEEITCTLSAFSLPANGTTTATLTFGSTAASSTLVDWQKMTFLCLLCALAISFTARRKRHYDLVYAALVFAILALGAACGGGGGNSGGGGGVLNAGTPIGAVQPLSVSITINGTAQTVPNLSVTVQ